MVFYTYLWLREDGTPYYVGKGSGTRAFTSACHGVHRPPQDERILLEEQTSETEAFEVERFLISFYGRLDLGTGCLRNLTDGGDGAVGAVRSAETRLRMSGPKTPEHRERIRLARLRQPAFSPVAREKMRKAKLGKIRDPQAVQKMHATFADPAWRLIHLESLRTMKPGVRGPYKQVSLG